LDGPQDNVCPAQWQTATVVQNTAGDAPASGRGRRRECLWSKTGLGRLAE